MELSEPKDVVVYFGAGFDMSPLLAMFGDKKCPLLAGVRAATLRSRVSQVSAANLDVSLSTLQCQKVLVCADHFMGQAEDLPEEHHMNRLDRLIAWVSLVVPKKPIETDFDREEGILTWTWKKKKMVYYARHAYKHADTPFMRVMRKEYLPRMGVLYSSHRFFGTQEFFDEWMRPCPIVIASTWYFDTTKCMLERHKKLISDPAEFVWGGSRAETTKRGIVVVKDSGVEKGTTYIEFYNATLLELVCPPLEPFSI